jgi:hypothetical protein
MGTFNTGDCLIEVTAWAGLTVYPSESTVFLQTVVSISQHYKNPSKCVCLIPSRHHYRLIECNLFSSEYSRKIAHLALNNNHSLQLQ